MLSENLKNSAWRQKRGGIFFPLMFLKTPLTNESTASCEVGNTSHMSRPSTQNATFQVLTLAAESP